MLNAYCSLNPRALSIDSFSYPTKPSLRLHLLLPPAAGPHRVPPMVGARRSPWPRPSLFFELRASPIPITCSPRPSRQHGYEFCESQTRGLGAVTNEWQKLPSPSLRAASWNAAVLCAASASHDCDHLDDCVRGRPFLVVLVATMATQSTMSVYSSDPRLAPGAS